jgi:AraC-like DNA-binding protein
MHEVSPSNEARLWLPRLSLTACLRAVLSRSTLGRPPAEACCVNHFPATPVCTISWFFEGHSEWLDPTLAPMPADPVLFSGPQTGPTTSRNTGPGHAMMLMLLPDALHAMTGLDPSAWIDRTVSAHAVLPPDWLAWGEAVRRAADDERRVALIEDFLEARWQAARPSSTAVLGSPLLHDWTQGLALRAASSAPGRSLRQFERRIKRWTGQPLRQLKGISRTEVVFFEVLAAQQRGAVDWADVAVLGGFADQSHLCRETRRVTGFSPEELRQRMQEEESFWVYRLWGAVLEGAQAERPAGRSDRGSRPAPGPSRD